MWFLAFPTTAPLVGSLLVRHRRADLLDVEGQEIIEVDSLSAIRSEVAPPRRPGNESRLSVLVKRLMVLDTARLRSALVGVLEGRR
jgi:hypothetical protein